MIRGIQTRGLLGFFNHYLLSKNIKIYVALLLWIKQNRVILDGNTICINNPLIPIERKHLFYLNLFELPERESVKKYIDPSLPVIELGGSIGVVACLTNKLLASPDKHIVVEAHPLFVETLKKNKTTNQCKFTIIEKAIGYSGPEVNFGGIEFSNRIDGTANGIRIPTTTLQEVAQANQINEFTLICDIEGTEIELLCHEALFIQSHIKLIIMEVHPGIVGEIKTKDAIDKLQALDFKLIHHEQDVYVFKHYDI